MKTFKNYVFSFFSIAFIFLGMMANRLHAQVVSPYSLSPDWAFGVGARAVFPSGDFPTSGAPVLSSRATNTVPSPEASTSICFSDGSVALYTNTTFAYNGASSGAWTSYIRNFNNTGDNTCASSSTGGAVAFPDPASPAGAFYLVLANDMTGGNCANQGVNYYRFTGTGTTVAYASGPTNICPSTFASEAIASATDGTGGYWVVVHNQGGTNKFRVWHFTKTGITGPTNYTIGANVWNTAGTQSYLKFSPCQDKLAYNSGGIIVVNSFNRTTGVVGAELYRINTSLTTGVGLEFSPDGSKLFYSDWGSGSGGQVYYYDFATATETTLTGATSWSMQLGPDGKIYASPTGTNLGIISNPNTAPSFTTTALAAGTSIFRGIDNLTWLSPNSPSITNSISNCDVNFGHSFKNYFNSSVGVTASSFSWNFGDGNTASGTTAPSHSYASSGSYNVTVSFKDATCAQTWSANATVSVTCSLPVNMVDLSANYNHGQTNVIWTTDLEFDNDYFEIQRSMDGLTFVTLGSVKSKGNSSGSKTYSFADPAPLSGVNYYRIVQHDKNGKQSTSSLTSVNVNTTIVNVKPNPFSSSFELSVHGSEVISVIITDIVGRVLIQTNATNSIGNHKLSFGENFDQGIYYVKVIAGNKIYSERLVKN